MIRAREWSAWQRRISRCLAFRLLISIWQTASFALEATENSAKAWPVGQHLSLRTLPSELNFLVLIYGDIELPNVAGFTSQRQWIPKFCFLERYLDWLAPCGVLVTIVPDSVLTNRGLFSELRSAVSKSAELLSVVSLPKVTFEMAGTSTKTSILHLRKKSEGLKQRTYFSVCHNIGYGVITKGSQRYRIPRGGGQLPRVLGEALGKLPAEMGRWVLLDRDAARWDATFHAGLPRNVQQRLETPKSDGLRVSNVARISKERADPRRSGEEEFRYVEISDVDAQTCVVRYKLVRCVDAPSRARKVIRSGDVLVSTVRPERRTVGVVGEELDGGICSTGFAVLRPRGIDSHILAKLLQNDFANAQILRNNVGIAYPAVDEEAIGSSFACKCGPTRPLGVLRKRGCGGPKQIARS